MQEITKIQNKDECIKEMLENGVQYGRAKRFTNSKLRDFLIKSNKTVEIFDVVKTLEKLEEAENLLNQFLLEDKTILFVGIQPAASQDIEKIAKILKQSYLAYKWVGGFLTNFATIRMRVKFFEDLREKKESGEIDTYSPIEKSRIMRELQKMENIYSGVVNLKKIPDAIFTVNLDYKPHKTMYREAKRMGIPIIGICGSDNDPDKFKIFVPANDKAPRSIKWLINHMINKLSPEIEHILSEEAEEIPAEQNMPQDINQNDSDANSSEIADVNKTSSNEEKTSEEKNG